MCAASALVASCSSVDSATTTSTTSPTTTSTSPTTTVATTTTTQPATTTTTLAPTTTEPPAPDRTLPVPDHAAPTIDGVIADGEWDGAIDTTMSDGSLLSWMRSSETLYVALRGHSVGAVNLAIASNGELWILHSSAALGSMRYVEDGEVWTLVHDFDWCCRGTNNEASRLALLEDEGWQASIGFAGDPGTVEYEVILPWIGAATAVAYRTQDAEPEFWPTDLSAEAAAELISPFPEEASFHVDEWTWLEALVP